MSRQIKSSQITMRYPVFLYAGVVTLLVCVASAAITYISFREFEENLLIRAVFISVITPLLLAYPLLYISYLRNQKLQNLSKVLELREKELKEFINIIPDIVTTADPALRLTSVNRKYCEITGQNSDVLVGRDFMEVVHPKSFDDVASAVNALSSEHPISTHEQLHINPDGTELWIYWTNLMRFDVDNQPVEILSVGKDITELHYAQLEIEEQAEKLEQTNKELEKANKELEQFTSIASHDLQEPLRKIGYFAELLAEAIDEKDEKTVNYALDVLSDSANRSRTQVSNLLTLSRTSNRPLETAWIDISEVLDSVISDLSVLIENTHAKIVREEEKVEVEGDWQLTGMILLNIIQNAIKFAHAKRTPEIRVYVVSKNETEYVLAIEDNGIGFENKYEKNIFTAFQRLHSRQEYEGAGIGLAIVKTAVERQGWQVSAKSAPGHGATFYIEIPIGSKSSVGHSNQSPGQSPGPDLDLSGIRQA